MSASTHWEERQERWKREGMLWAKLKYGLYMGIYPLYVYSISIWETEFGTHWTQMCTYLKHVPVDMTGYQNLKYFQQLQDSVL